MFSRHNSSISVNETGKSITFKLYALGGVARIVSTTSDLVSTVENETVAAPTIAGTILPACGRLNSLPGPSLAVATGQITDSNSDPIGHLSFARAIDFTHNSANQLDLTLVYSDLDDPVDAIKCDLSNPSDVSYSLHNGIGTLTLTISSSDTCFQTASPSITLANTGNSIALTLDAPFSGDSLVVSTASNLVDGHGDVNDDLGVVGALSFPH